MEVEGRIKKVEGVEQKWKGIVWMVNSVFLIFVNVTNIYPVSCKRNMRVICRIFLSPFPVHPAAAAAAAKSLQSCPTLCDPTDGNPPGSPSLGFSRQEHWSGLPLPSPSSLHRTDNLSP